MENLKVYRRKGAGAADESAARYQEACDNECIRLVNSRESTACPMATMQINLTEQVEPEKPKIRKVIEDFHSCEAFGVIFGAGAVTAAVCTLNGMVAGMIACIIATIVGFAGLVFA